MNLNALILKAETLGRSTERQRILDYVVVRSRNLVGDPQEIPKREELMSLIGWLVSRNREEMNERATESTTRAET